MVCQKFDLNTIPRKPGFVNACKKKVHKPMKYFAISTQMIQKTELRQAAP